MRSIHNVFGNLLGRLILTGLAVGLFALSIWAAPAISRKTSATSSTVPLKPSVAGPEADSLQPFSRPPSQGTRLDLGVTGGYDRWPSAAEVAAEGIKRIYSYYNWRELEPMVGTYAFDQLDQEINEAGAAGVRIALAIPLTEVGCPSGSPDSCWFQDKLPDGVTFSRTSSRFDHEPFITLLPQLVRTVMQRYDPNVLTHVYLGNETDSYWRDVQWTDDIDLFPGFLNLMSAIQQQVNTLPQPRPKFGTALTFYAFPEYYDDKRQLAPVVDILGLTMYPTDPDWDETLPFPQLIARWLNAAREVTEGRSIAITEIAHPAVRPYSTPQTQKEYVRALFAYLKANPTAFEYASWWSLYDSPSAPYPWFTGMGLMTLQGQKRPAFDLWAKQRDGADLDFDCDVDGADITQVSSRWGTHAGNEHYDLTYDLDNDGDGDIVDIMLVAAQWGGVCQAIM